MMGAPRVSKAWFVWLYFLEGAPIGWVWWVLPVQLTQQGVSIDRVTALTSLLTLPWAFKFLWAPVVDRYAHRFGYRPWIWGGLVGMGVCLLMGGTTLNWAWLVMYSFFAASQDAAIDGFAMATVPEEERGRLNGAMQVGMISGRWLFGSGMLLAASWVSFELQRNLLVGLIGVSVCLMFFFPDHRPQRQAPAVGAWLRSLPSKPFLLAGLGVAFFSGLGFESLGAVAGPFLLGLGLTPQAIGGFFSFSLICMLLGAVGGGVLSDRIGHARVFRGAVVGIWLVTVGVATASLLGDTGVAVHYGLLLLAYGGMGVFLSAAYAFFMDLGDATAYRATTFSAMMGSTNACESFSAWTVGRIIPVTGYGPAMAILGSFSLLALLLFRYARPPKQVPTSD